MIILLTPRDHCGDWSDRHSQAHNILQHSKA